MLRAKFQVQERKNYHTATGEEIIMRPVYWPDPESENHHFWKASPSGQLTLFISNPEAIGKLEIGKFYYIDFTEAPE